MTETIDTGRSPAWHFWVVAVLGALWNSFGGYDYFMSKTGGDAYLKSSGMSEAQIAYFNAMPAWTTIFWALGVWGAVAGSILLLLRSRWAVHAFLISLGGLIVSLIYDYLLSNGLEVNGQQQILMYCVIFAACAFFLWYSQRMVKAGVLR